MLEYLQKYNNLPQELRLKLAQPGVISAIQNLEAKYQISLALTVIKAAVAKLNPQNLESSLMANFKLSASVVQSLARDLTLSVFFVLPAFSASSTTTKPQTATATETEAVKAVPNSTPNTAIKTPSAIDLRVDDIISKGKIDLASRVLQDRLKQILRTYLLGVRDRLAAADALTRAFELGGMSFSQTTAEDILKIADGKIDASEKSLRPRLPDNLAIHGSQRDAAYNLVDALKAKGTPKLDADPMATTSRLAQATVASTPKPTSSLPSNLPWQAETVAKQAPALDSSPALIEAKPVKNKFFIKEEIKAPAVATQAVADSAPIVKAPAPEQVRDTSSVLAPAPTAPAMPEALTATQIKSSSPALDQPAMTFVKRTPQTVVPPAQVKEKFQKTDTGKIKMNDIHFTPRVFTPIDELKYMTLKNFRNLSVNPEEAALLITRKLETLAREEYSWKLEGVSAFKQSPVNTLYTDIFHTAMSQGKQIAEVINEKITTAPDDALTQLEFDALYKLNQVISLIK